MTRLAQPQDSLFIQNRSCCIHIHGKLCFGKDKIENCHQFPISENGICMLGKRGGKHSKDHFDLFSLLLLKLFYFIVQIHYCCRLDKKCGTCLGSFVHHTRNLPLTFCFDRQTIPVIPHSDHCVLQIGAVASVYHGKKLGMDLFTGRSKLTADLTERGAGIIRIFILCDDAAADLCLDVRQRLQFIKKSGKTVGIFLFHTTVAFDARNIFKLPGDLQKLCAA